jgi:dihydrofolate reductase
MRLTLIAALDEDGAIGLPGGGLPWHVPDETAHFRAYCAGQWLLVGRRTFAEMTGWFRPDHHVIVLTRAPLTPETPVRLPPNLQAAPTMPAAIDAARRSGAPELVVIGGARTYAEALPVADQLVLSRLALRSGGTVMFPVVDWAKWTLRHREPERVDQTTGVGFHVDYWERGPK